MRLLISTVRGEIRNAEDGRQTEIRAMFSSADKMSAAPFAKISTRHF
jgi:hypothetical protein